MTSERDVSCPSSRSCIESRIKMLLLLLPLLRLAPLTAEAAAAGSTSTGDLRSSASRPCRVAYTPGGASLSFDEFLNSSCCMCHRYLFEHTPSLSSARCVEAVGERPDGQDTSARLVIGNESVPASDVYPATADLVCDIALRGDKSRCTRWRDCCKAAASCCSDVMQAAAASKSERQPTHVLLLPPSTAVTAPPACPATWDGWQCWPAAKADSRSRAPCPDFLYPGYDCGKADLPLAVRECSSDGAWARDNSTQQEQSDYGECAQPVHCIEGIMQLNWHLTYACQAVSLLALSAALFVYLSYRNLRNQPRILIHVNLCSAMFLYGVINVAYTAAVKKPSVSMDGDSSIMGLNTAICRALNALEKFALLAVYLSMFLEGLYLHWLLVSSFRQPRLRLLLAPCWGFAVLATVAYSVTKAMVADEICWTKSVEVVEWVCYYAPSIAAVTLNLAFLVNIQRILWRQLQAHREEPSSYRRAVKAALTLVPPFGLTMMFLVYHPSPDGSFLTRVVYECIAAAVINLQGFFVVLVLCVCNAEVRGTVHSSWRRPRKPHHDHSLSLMHTYGYSHKSAGGHDVLTTTMSTVATAHDSDSVKRALPCGGGTNGFAATAHDKLGGAENLHLLNDVRA